MKTASRSSTASPCSSSPERHVRKNPDRQSWRNRPAGAARLPRTGRQDRGRALGSRPRGQICTPGRRVRLHRARHTARQLPEHAGADFGCRGHRRRGHPPRLRLPVGKCRFRRAGGKERLRVHRAASRKHPHHGRQGQRQAGHDRRRRARRAGLGRRAARRCQGNPAHRRRGRLSGHHQGGGRRRRARHAGGLHRGRPAQRRRHDAHRGWRRLQQPRGLPGKIPGKPAPYRDPGVGRRRGQGRLAGRARLLHAAPPPEDHRGSARPGHRPRPGRTHRRTLRRGLPPDALSRRRHFRVPVRERGILLHRDEHPHPGRAHDH